MKLQNHIIALALVIAFLNASTVTARHVNGKIRYAVQALCTQCERDGKSKELSTELRELHKNLSNGNNDCDEETLQSVIKELQEHGHLHRISHTEVSAPCGKTRDFLRNIK